MNPWITAATVLVASLVPVVVWAARHGPHDALVALQLAGTISVLALVLLTLGFHRPFIDLALVLALLSGVGALTFVRFLEHGTG